MGSKIAGGVLLLVLMLGSVGQVLAQDDSRVIARLGHNGPKDPVRIASVYLAFEGEKADGFPTLPWGDENRVYAEVWEGLYLQVVTESANRGVAGYLFSFSKDEARQEELKVLEPEKDATLREVAAADFRTDDNFAPEPLKPGPGTLEDPGALRVIHYDGFDVEIRVLGFRIGNAELKKTPYFKSINFLVTVVEKKPKARTK